MSEGQFILNNITYSNSGNYTQNYYNYLGCDSTLQLTLTVQKNDKTVTKNGGIVSANMSGATYQWLDCNNNKQTISGANGQSYTPIVSGNYAVIVTKNNCTDTSDCFAVTSINVNAFIYNHFKVSPNPASLQAKITASNSQNIHSIRLLNALGQVVFETENIDSNVFVLSLEKLNSGIYILEINNGQQIERHRLVKE